MSVFRKRPFGEYLSFGQRLCQRALSSGLITFVQGQPQVQTVIDAGPLVGQVDSELVTEYEVAFAHLIGAGSATSFASGRMAFFVLLKVLAIGTEDEVILPGSTCAVMVNAVIRSGATPVFSDVSSESFGSSAEGVTSRLTARTKIIVAQHSFGYPCHIDEISVIAKASGVFLLEDCATTLGSTVNGQTVGTFGDAALFSTDHTKPLNTHIGGILYTEDRNLHGQLQEVAGAANELAAEQQHAMWNRLALESRHSSAVEQKRLFLRDLRTSVFAAGKRSPSPFLSEDFGSDSSMPSYPYPSRLPTFVAAIGLGQVARWNELKTHRVSSLCVMRQALAQTAVGQHLPKVLADPSMQIVPLRLAWSQPNGDAIRHRLASFIATEGTWFMQPIVATPEPPENFGYKWGSCPESERLGPGMVNLPIPDDPHAVQILIDRIQRHLL